MSPLSSRRISFRGWRAAHLLICLAFTCEDAELQRERRRCSFCLFWGLGEERRPPRLEN